MGNSSGVLASGIGLASRFGVAAVYALLCLRACKICFHAMQQNGYRVWGTSYFRALGRMGLRMTFALTLTGAVCGAISLRLPRIGLLLAAAGCALSLFCERGVAGKTPLVYTNRIKRTAVLLYVLLTAIGSVSGGYAAFVPMFLPFLVFVSFTLLLPVEAGVRKRFLKRCSARLEKYGTKVIGITGSAGKTGVKRILTDMLAKKYRVLATPESYNTPMGVAKTVNELLTPEIEYLIVEMGARNPGDIRELCELTRPTAGIVTAVFEQHMETFGSIDNVTNTKFELPEYLAGRGFCVLNGDNERIRNRLLEMISYGDDMTVREHASTVASADVSGVAFENCAEAEAAGSVCNGEKNVRRTDGGALEESDNGECFRKEECGTEYGESEGEECCGIRGEEEGGAEYGGMSGKEECGAERCGMNGEEEGGAAWNEEEREGRSFFGEPLCSLYTVGSRTPRADFRLKEASCDAEGSLLTLGILGKEYRVRTALLGRHQWNNILTAAYTALLLGVAPSDVVEAIGELKAVPHRLEVVSKGKITVLDDSYNANPEGARYALECLSLFEGRRIVVTPGLIEEGAYTQRLNRELGRTAARYCEIAFFIGRNADCLREGAEEYRAQTGDYRCAVFTADNLKKASEALSEKLRYGDVVLFENDLPDCYEKT